MRRTIRKNNWLWAVMVVFGLLVQGAVAGGDGQAVVVNYKEWLLLFVRWLHVIAAIMWIGSSIWFMWLDSSVEKMENSEADEAHQGRLWMVHGGGYYEVEKRLLQAGELEEKHLHWFKWESYMTWISGVSLLILVYYMSKGAYLIDPSVSGISNGHAIALGLALLPISWIVYVLTWRMFGWNQWLAVIISIVEFVLLVYFLFHALSGRGAYIHVGAVLGTLMAGNVFFHIIPNQKSLVRAAKEGVQPNSRLGVRAKMHSRHNNYMTYPVIFIMISSHFSGTYGHSLGWLMLIIISLTSAIVRHFMNIRWRFKAWLLCAAVTLVIGAALLLNVAQRPNTHAGGVEIPEGANAKIVPFSQVETIIKQRCVSCHSASPTDTSVPVPAGVFYDNPEQIKRFAVQIKAQSVETTAMPLGNKTGMQAKERVVLGMWIEQGARISFDDPVVPAPKPEKEQATEDQKNEQASVKLPAEPEETQTEKVAEPPEEPKATDDIELGN